MGNFIRVAGLRGTVISIDDSTTDGPRVGLDHVTVVPTNHEPAAPEVESDGEAESDAEPEQPHRG